MIDTRQFLGSDAPRGQGDARRRLEAIARWLALAVALPLVPADPADAARRQEAIGEEAPALAPLAAVALQHLDFDARPGATVLGFTASAPLLHHTVYEAGDHVIIELPGTDVASLEPTAEIGTPEVGIVLVESVPTASGNLARVTIQRAPGTRRQVSIDPTNPRRLEVTISAEGAPAAASPSETPAHAGRRLAAAETAAPARPAASPAMPEPVTHEQVARLRDDPPVPEAAPSRAAGRTATAPLGLLDSLGRPAGAAAPAMASRADGRTIGSARGGRLLEARVEEAQDGRTVLRLTSTGALQGQAFILDTPPPRLVVDLPGTVNEVASGSIPVRDEDVLKIRVAQNQPLPQPVTRVVIELRAEGVPYELIEGPNTLLVAIGRATGRRGPALASLDPAFAMPAATSSAGERQADLLTLPEGPGFEGLGRPVGRDGNAPPPMRESADASVGGPAKVISTEDASRFASVQVTTGTPQYQGDPISISMKDAELQDIFRLFHQFTGLNIIVDQSVRGKTITLDLVDVPWDQALALVLQTNGLGSQLDGNVLRIAPLTKLAAEEQQKKAWQEAQEIAGELEQLVIPLSYATAQTAEPILRKSLSSRGDIQTDRRTNTIIVKDLPGRLEDVRRLVALLDTPTRQVQIEARIIETTVDFQKSTGVRWGFNYIADRALGNQTGFSFPRSIASDYAVNLPANGSNGTLGLSFRNILNTFTLDLQLQALESRGKARVISRPMVMVQNNREAEISSGFNIPITNTTATETDVTFVPATLSLRVTPQITADNNVIMDIEVHNDTPGFLVGDNPSISTRNAKTTVAVPDGGTTVIGGIYQVNEGTSSGRVPFLSRIPLLGWLFRNKSVDRTNDELLIFLTPRIQKAI